MAKYLDIVNREEDHKLIYDQTWRAELGIRAIAIMYHEHSEDQNSYENIFKLKDNIEYRLFSSAHQYLILLQELRNAEIYLEKIYKEDPLNISTQRFWFSNPYFDKSELEISSVFDSLIFQITSVYDYLSHALCYMYFKNKQDTVDWKKLANIVRGELKGKYRFCEKLDMIDRSSFAKLNEYRSRLIHKNRDKHNFSGSLDLIKGKMNVFLFPSGYAIKTFKKLSQENPDKKFTLAYLASWLFKDCFQNIEDILSAVKEDLETNSRFYQNMGTPKFQKTLIIGSINSSNNSFEPVSKRLWEEYLKK